MFDNVETFSDTFKGFDDVVERRKEEKQLIKFRKKKPQESIFF